MVGGGWRGPGVPWGGRKAVDCNSFVTVFAAK